MTDKKASRPKAEKWYFMCEQRDTEMEGLIARGMVKVYDGTGGKKLEPGVPCGHPGCLNHASHPCEGCGRNQGEMPEKKGNR